MPPQSHSRTVEAKHNQYIYITKVIYIQGVEEEVVVVEGVVEDLGVVEEVEGLVRVVMIGIT